MSLSDMIDTLSISELQLQKKYHQDLVFNYAEYPTKDHWSFDFNNTE